MRLLHGDDGSTLAVTRQTFVKMGQGAAPKRVSPARNSHRDEGDVEEHAYCSLKRFLDDPRLTIGPAVCIGADTRGAGSEATQQECACP